MNNAENSDEHDGRRSSYRWIILGASFTLLTTSFLIRLAWGNASSFAAADIGLTSIAVGEFVTAFYVGYTIGNLFGGFTTDRFGPRELTGWSVIPVAVCVSLFGMITHSASGIVLQCMIGLAVGTSYAATTKICAAWFDSSERGFAFGVLGTAASIAVIGANSFFPELIAHLSWRTVYLVLGVAVGIAMSVCFLLLRNTPIPASANPDNLLSVGTVARRLGANRDFIILSLAGIGGVWGTWGFVLWANALMTAGYKIGPVESGKIVAIFGLWGFISKPIYGWLSDLCGKRRKAFIVACLATFSAALMAFSIQHNAHGFALVAPFLGITAFAYSPLLLTMMSEVVSRSELGAAAGIFNAIHQLGTIAAPVIVGIVFQETTSFVWTFATLAAGPCFGAICMLFVRDNRSPP
jgi:sugar phosphate permease